MSVVRAVSRPARQSWGATQVRGGHGGHGPQPPAQTAVQRHALLCGRRRFV